MVPSQLFIKYLLFMVMSYSLASARVCAQPFSLYKLFLYMLVYKVTPHLSNGTCPFGFSSHELVNTQVLKCLAHQGVVRQAK